MVGVDILNKEEILGTPEWVYVASIIFVYVLIISITILFVSAFNLWNTLFIFSAIAAIVSWVLVIVLCNVDEIEPTGRYRYEATIDESVSIADVYEHYKVVEQRGYIWVLEDKEE